jgi:hypothetical protein
MRGYDGRDPNEVTAMFRLEYEAAIRRCDVCERCGKSPVSKALRIKDPVEEAFDAPPNLLAVCDCSDGGNARVSLTPLGGRQVGPDTPPSPAPRLARRDGREAGF